MKTILCFLLFAFLFVGCYTTHQTLSPATQVVKSYGFEVAQSTSQNPGPSSVRINRTWEKDDAGMFNMTKESIAVSTNGAQEFKIRVSDYVGENTIMYLGGAILILAIVSLFTPFVGKSWILFAIAGATIAFGSFLKWSLAPWMMALIGVGVLVFVIFEYQLAQKLRARLEHKKLAVKDETPEKE